MTLARERPSWPGSSQRDEDSRLGEENAHHHARKSHLPVAARAQGQVSRIIRDRSGDVLRANYGSNPWQEKNQVITSVSWVSRVEDAQREPVAKPVGT